MLSNLLKKCEDTINFQAYTNIALKTKINTNIIDTFDTLRNADMLFEVLSQSKEDTPFASEIFGITLYFINKLFALRTQSLQKKFKGLFLNDPACPSFFLKINKYITSHNHKIRKGVLRPFLILQRYTDELSPKSYYVDKNLEKQIIEFLRFLCKNGNTFMQDYLK
jgi:hypothetical protein